MNDRKRRYSVHFLALAILTTVALSMVNYLAMSNNTRIDLTTDKRFTLSEGTKKIFERLTEPITVTYYVDEQLPSARVNLERDVTDKLKELQVSSNGKMIVKIERIAEAEVQERKPELEALGIRVAVDVKIVGKDTSAAARGVQEFYSSIEVRYSGAVPYVINDIFNLVSENDSYAEHRVDTLEFDIAYALLRMKNQVAKKNAQTLVQTLDEELTIYVILSEQMPVANPKLRATILAGVDKLKTLGGENVSVINHEVAYGEIGGGLTREIPFYEFAQGAEVSAPPTGQRPAEFFYAMLFCGYRGLLSSVPVVFKDEKDVDSVLTAISNFLWEIVKPKNRVGVIHPPVAPPTQQNPRGGQSPYRPLSDFIRQQLGYDVAIIDWKEHSRIPEDISLLLVFESNMLAERELYEIERYLLRGGNVMMFHQGWSMDPFLRNSTHTATLLKEPLNDNVRDWAAHLGVKFSDHLLMQKNGTMKPYSADPRTGRPQAIYTDMSFAPVVRQENYSKESVFTRGLTDLPMPLPVAIELDESKTSTASLKVDKLFSLPAKDLFKLIPENPSFPQVQLDWRFNDSRKIEMNSANKPDEGIRLQAVGKDALIGVSLSGTFNSYWSGKNSEVPAWPISRQDDKFTGKDAPSISKQPGRLSFFSSVGMLKIGYYQAVGTSDSDNISTYFKNGVRFYRNFMDASIYGEDLVSLRSKSGIAPRIGAVESADKTVWYLICLGGTPLALALAALLLNIMRNNKRREYEAALGTQTGASND
ncbi:MAG: GldG family protein [Planctomycetes bacterium]|nr:GldG family protein [Planctomycetota bacterium]